MVSERRWIFNDMRASGIPPRSFGFFWVGFSSLPEDPVLRARLQVSWPGSRALLSRRISRAVMPRKDGVEFILVSLLAVNLAPIFFLFGLSPLGHFQ